MAAQGAAWARSLLTRRSSEPAAEHARVQRELDEDGAAGLPTAAQRLGGGGDAAGAAVATSSTSSEYEDERARVGHEIRSTFQVLRRGGIVERGG